MSEMVSRLKSSSGQSLLLVIVSAASESVMIQVNRWRRLSQVSVM